MLLSLECDGKFNLQEAEKTKVSSDKSKLKGSMHKWRRDNAFCLSMEVELKVICNLYSPGNQGFRMIFSDIFCRLFYVNSDTLV